MLRTSLHTYLGNLLLLTLCLPGCASGDVTPGELEDLRAVLQLKPGMHVADVGAGSGKWSETLLSEVGPLGHVYSTEVEEDDVAKLRENLEATGLENFTTILGDQDSTGLPADCCDAILLRLVYHHFTDPPSMRESLGNALHPGAFLVVVDIRPQGSWDELEGVPERDGHGIAPEDLIEEMTSDGFEVVSRREHWESDDDHYCVVFRRSPDAAD